MDNRKMTLLVAASVMSVFMFSACEFMPTLRSQGDNDSVTIAKAERDSVLESRNLFGTLSKDMQDDLLNILWEIDDIAGETFELERKREREGSVESRVADRIKKRIASVRVEIENTDKKASERPQLRMLLSQLRSSLLEKEDEIDRLKQTLQRKKTKLQEKYQELEYTRDDFQERISLLESERQRLEKEQAALYNSRTMAWGKAGDKLREGLDLIIITKKQKLGKKVREAKIRIARQAIECYEKAKAAGDPLAEEKIREMEIYRQRLINGENI